MDDDQAHDAQIRELLRELARADEWWHCRGEDEIREEDR